MRVAFINVEGGHTGGAGSIVSDIACTVQADGGKSLICYGRLGIPEEGLQLYRIGSDLDVYYHAMMSRVFDNQGLYSQRATQKLLKVINEFEPDVINLHLLHGYYLNYKILFEYLKNAGKPVVWTFHDSWAYTGHCATFESVNCEKWKIQCNNCPKKNVYPRSYWLDNSERNYKLKKKTFSGLNGMTIVTPSQWLADKVKVSFLNEYPCYVINNGIDFDAYHPCESDFKKKYHLEGYRVILGVAASWSVYKGLDDLFKLSEMLPSNYRIVLVGLTKEQLRELPPTITGIERTTNRQELMEAYSAAEVFVDPTIEDNFPTVILEALACGTPVVTYDTGGCKEEVDETCGIVVKQHDLEAMKNGIIHFVEDGIFTELCIERARCFDKKEKCREYLDLFKKEK